MSLDSQVLTLVLNRPERLLLAQQAGVTAEDFDEMWQSVWNFVVRMKRDHAQVPSKSVVQTRYPDVFWSKVRSNDLPILLHQLRERRRMNDFLSLLMDSARLVTQPEDVPDVMQALQGGLNQLQMRNGASHLVNVFSPEYKDEIIKEIRARRRPEGAGLLTGFPKFDAVTGGLQRKRMVVVIGRTGLGKSWLDLFFVAEGIRRGAKVLLYPLEMSLDETCMRLYTIFSQKIFGGNRVLRNLDLTRGRINKRKFLQLLSVLEDQYNGQLLIADIGRLSDPYTVERVEAEVEIHQPDMFWVDYLTLLKAPQVHNQEEWSSVRVLSNGIKSIAARHNTIGGCSAQVNREAIKGRAFLPRLEHIAYGDSIGQDADQVISINRKGDKLFWAMVKNRLGPEIPRVMCSFQVDSGVLEEIPEEDDAEAS